MKKLIDTIIFSKIFFYSCLPLIIFLSITCATKEIQKTKESPSQEIIVLEKENFETKQKEIKDKK